MKLIYLLIVGIFSSIALVGVNDQKVFNNDARNAATPTPVPTRTPGTGPKPGTGCSTCMPGELNPRKRFEIPLIRPDRKMSDFKAVSILERNESDTKTEFSVEIEGLDKNRQYYVYTIDEEGKVTKVDTIKEGKNRITTRTRLKSLIVAVSTEDNIREVDTEKFVFITEPAESSTKLRELLELNTTVPD